MAERECVGVIGATSFVGQCVLPLLKRAEFKVAAFSRKSGMESDEYVRWHLASSARNPMPEDRAISLEPSSTKPGIERPSTNSARTAFNGDAKGVIPYWIYLAPILVVPEYFQLLKASGAKRVVVLSSTSRFTKDNSSVASERLFAQHLINAENSLQVWAKEQGIEWVILRPTLIYGLGEDKNISEIIRLIRRFRFFPLFGHADGLRQPVHAHDVAMACFSALWASGAANKSYNLSGGEALTYKEMVERVFTALGRKPFFVRVPIAILRTLIRLLRYLPRYRTWTPAMVERMNKDMAFDHHDAMQDLGFTPRAFVLVDDDIPN